MFIGNANISGRRTDGSIVYLLDTYSAAAAYSLRQLKTGVTNVVRVRRSSDNAESDFTADEITDGTLTTWTGANDGFIADWYDQTGNAKTISNATSAQQPKLVSGGVVITKNGEPAAQFDGSVTRLFRSGVAFVNTTDVSYFSVSAARVGNTVGAIHNQNSANTQTIRTFHDSRAANKVQLVVSNTTPTTYLADMSTFRNNTDQVLKASFIDSSKNMSAFDNGATGTTDTYTGTVNNNGLELGRQFAASYLDGYIQEFIAFNTDESANRTAIETDINTHYSIY